LGRQLQRHDCAAAGGPVGTGLTSANPPGAPCRGATTLPRGRVEIRALAASARFFLMFEIELGRLPCCTVRCDGCPSLFSGSDENTTPHSHDMPVARFRFSCSPGDCSWTWRLRVPDGLKRWHCAASNGKAPRPVHTRNKLSIADHSKSRNTPVLFIAAEWLSLRRLPLTDYGRLLWLFWCD
jgi:hypothetical protein